MNNILGLLYRQDSNAWRTLCRWDSTSFTSNKHRQQHLCPFYHESNHPIVRTMRFTINHTQCRGRSKTQRSLPLKVMDLISPVLPSDTSHVFCQTSEVAHRSFLPMNVASKQCSRESMSRRDHARTRKEELTVDERFRPSEIYKQGHSSFTAFRTQFLPRFG